MTRRTSTAGSTITISLTTSLAEKLRLFLMEKEPWLADAVGADNATVLIDALPVSSPRASDPRPDHMPAIIKAAGGSLP